MIYVPTTLKNKPKALERFQSQAGAIKKPGWKTDASLAWPDAF